MLVTRARDTSAYFAFCNLVGGQDELVFDGHSVVLDDAGEVVARASGFAEELLVVDVDPTEAMARRLRDVRRRELDRSREREPQVEFVELGATPEHAEEVAGSIAPFEPELEQMRLALTLGLRDYVDKNGFTDVVVAVSGGIDSAVTAALCADALGPDRVHCVSMPSRFSSEGTRDDARAVAESLGCTFREIPIESDPRRVPRGPRGRDRRRSRGSRRREPAGTCPRRPAHGAVEHLRVARGLDGEQVGAGRRVLDPLRRHGRWLRAPEGRVQDGRVPPRRAPERARGPRRDPSHDDRARAERRASRRPARLRFDPAVRRARSRARGIRGGGPVASRSCSRSSIPRSSSGPSASSTAPSTSAARPRRA